MKKIKKELSTILTKEIEEIFSQSNERTLIANHKNDASIVTEIDLLVSNFLKKELQASIEYKNYNFFSEEDYEKLTFPAAIVDPIDGTRELAQGRAECAVSLALMNSKNLKDPLNYAWIYNPFSGFSIDTNDSFVISNNHSLQNLSGMVSRSEYYKGFFSDIKNPKIHLIPRGSIAFKLGLLASGACDFIVSKNPKNIWDIAAGTMLANQRGYKFYLDGKEQLDLGLERYNGLLLWCKEIHLAELMTEFQK